MEGISNRFLQCKGRDHSCIAKGVIMEDRSKKALLPTTPQSRQIKEGISNRFLQCKAEIIPALQRE
jgi:hypothetical protein